MRQDFNPFEFARAVFLKKEVTARIRHVLHRFRNLPIAQWREAERGPFVGVYRQIKIVHADRRDGGQNV